MKYDFTCDNEESEFYGRVMGWSDSCDEFEPKQYFDRLMDTCQYCHRGELVWISSHYECRNCGQVNVDCCNGECS